MALAGDSVALSAAPAGRPASGKANIEASTSHLVPTFRSSYPTSAPTFHELRKGMGTSKLINSGAAFSI
jgi:hypothetical protein